MLTTLVQGKQLQTGFLVGMEYILGVTEKQKSTHGLARASQELGEDAVEADAVSEATKSRARDRYQRLFWEPITEGKVCARYFVPPDRLLTHAILDTCYTHCSFTRVCGCREDLYREGGCEAQEAP